MKTTQNLSANLVKCMVVAVTIVILSAGIADAGPRFNPHEAKGGLPDCMEKLNAITANLETNETNLAQAQEELVLQQGDLEACYMDLDQLIADLSICEENEGSSSPVLGVPKTGQIVSYYEPGDDGDLQKGAVWPVQRFTDNLDGTVTDNMTGLVWTKNANVLGTTDTWETAVKTCNTLVGDGTDLVDDGSIQGDWRLPNVKELNSLIDYGQYDPALPVGHPFLNVQLSPYWTSTTYTPSDYFSWGISLANGFNAPAYYKGGYDGFVWCVRDGL